MAKEVRIELTAAQKAKIKAATGKDMAEIRVSSVGNNPAVSPSRSISARALKTTAMKDTAARALRADATKNVSARALKTTAMKDTAARALRADATKNVSARALRSGGEDA